MENGDLPLELASRLPSTQDWHYTDAKYIERGDGVPPERPVLLHYDITRPIRLGFCSFERDPGLMPLLTSAGEITAVTVVIDQRRLYRQYLRREKPIKRLMMSAGLDRLRGRPSRLPLIPFYRDPSWVPALEESWSVFLSRFPGIRHVPVTSRAGGPWLLAQRP